MEGFTLQNGHNWYLQIVGYYCNEFGLARPN